MSGRKPITGKKAKLYSSRIIRTEMADPNFKDGVLSVPDFLNARQFEIKSFELSQLNTKYASSNRVFQNLPRSLRRRTASHNMKRIPKRLRSRAIREMNSSNDQASSGTAAKPSRIKGRERYRLRMAKKLLLLASKIKSLKSIPNDQIFNKDLKLKDKLHHLNEQINDLNSSTPKSVSLNNCLGSFDNTGINKLAAKPRGNLKYWKRQREFTWLQTHVWHAKRFHLMKTWGYQIPLSPTQKCFRPINRASRRSTIISDTSYYDCLIIETNNDEQLKQVLTLITKYKSNIPPKFANGQRSYDDWIYMDGKKVGKALVYCIKHLHKVLIRLHPCLYESYFQYLNHIRSSIGFNIHDCRYSLGSIELLGPTALNSLGKVLHLTDVESNSNWFNLTKLNDADNIPSDTTFAFTIKDPRIWDKPIDPPVKVKKHINDVIIDMNINPSIDLQSLKNLSHPDSRYESYKDQLTTKALGKLHGHPELLLEVKHSQHHKFPVFLTKLSNGNWCIITPWYWILPLWLKLTKVKHILLGGYKQLHQVNFQRNVPSFPTDYPFLVNGWLENELRLKLELEKYNRLPKSKQKQYSRFENGLSPFGCDWKFLATMIWQLKLLGNKKLSTSNEFASFNGDFSREIKTINDLVLNVQSIKPKEMCIELLDESVDFHNQFINDNYTITPPNYTKLPVKQINLKLLSKGNLKDNARIYKIPNNINEWNQYIQGTCNDPPPITDLIGFISSGAFNLTQGKSTGIGAIVANYTKSHVLVRDSGSSSTYPGIIEVCK